MTITKQELFDRAYKGVIAQGKACMVGGECGYFNFDGLRCAMAHAIDMKKEPDGKYVPSPTDYISSEGKYYKEVNELMRAMQRAHDSNSKFPDFLHMFKQDMICVAKQFNLVVPNE